MTQKRQMIYSADLGSDHLHLWQLDELVERAKAENFRPQSWVRQEYDTNFLRERLAIVEDPSKRCIHVIPNLFESSEPVPDTSDRRRYLSLSLAKHSDARKGVIARIRIESVDGPAVQADIDLDEHQFALLLSGQVIEVRDSA